MQLLVRSFKKAANISRRLPEPLFILHQTDAHKIITVFAEAKPRRHRNVCTFKKELGKFEAAKGPELLWDRCPAEHACIRCRDLPASPSETVHDNIPALLVDLPGLVDAFLRPVKCGGRRHLDRREGSVVEIRLHTRQRGHQSFVSDSKAHAPAGHLKTSWKAM